jgi:hypothetical protein
LSSGGLILLLFVLWLLAVLVWAGKPRRRTALSTEDMLGVLSSATHTSHLSPILQSLRPEDVEFLEGIGRPELAARLAAQRKQIGLLYLQALQNEFECLLAASRTLAMMSPQLMPMEEFERMKLSIRFELLCGYMRFRLKFGQTPQKEFGKLSEMAGRITIALEQATGAAVERATAGLK